METNNRLFYASFISLVTTAFGFIVRAFLIGEWGETYNLSQTQMGALQGAGLFPFALSIIFVSLFVDKIGYGKAMAAAWVGHVVSAIVTMTATSYTQLYIGTFLFALANGAVEAVVNPVVATVYAKEKSKYLNRLHAGWAGGLVLGGILFIAMGSASWQLKVGLFLLPAIVYGAMMLGCKFPVQERVTAGVSYTDMLKEFGWGGCLIVSYFVADAVAAVAGGMFNTTVPAWLGYVIIVVPTVLFAVTVRAFGRPMFIFLLLIMVLLATTELGTDSWVSEMLTPVLGGNGLWVLIYTSAIMLVLRIFSAGPLLARLSPVGLLMACSVLAAVGLYLISTAGNSLGLIFVAATLYGVGKTFFWPTTLGLVAEQFPKGGALTLNGVAGMGMIAVGVFGAPFLGTLQDDKLDTALKDFNPAIHAQVAGPEQTSHMVSFQPLDRTKIAALPADQKAAVEELIGTNKQASLARFAVLPALMALGFGILFIYFKSRGGYRAVEIGGGH